MRYSYFYALVNVLLRFTRDVGFFFFNLQLRDDIAVVCMSFTNCVRLNFLGVFARLRRATVSFVVSVCWHGTSRHVACDMRHDIRTRRMPVCDLLTDHK